MILNVHVPDAPSYDVGDEIWQESLADAVHAELEVIAEDAGSDRIEPLHEADRDALRDQISAEMTVALVEVGDTYRPPDGVLYSLSDRPPLDLRSREGRLDVVNLPTLRPIVEEILRFEDLPDRPAPDEP